MLKRILLLALPLVMTACSVTEVREREFIQTASFSQKNGDASVALCPFDAEETVTAQGETILTALESAEGLLGGALFLGHTELLGVGRGNLTVWLEELLDGNRISPSCKLMYAPEGKADAALIPILSQMADSGQLIAPSCGDGLRNLLGRSKKAVLPAVYDDGLTLAVVDENGMRLGFLDASACRGLFWLTGETAELTLSVEGAEEPVAFEVTKTCAELTAIPREEGLLLRVSLTVWGNAPQGDAQHSHAAAKEVRRICAAAIRQTVTACGADVIGIENAVAKADRAYYLAHEADWDALLRAAEVEISVDMKQG